MRLVPDKAQHAIYDSIFHQLDQADSLAFPFQLHRANLGTIEGDMEAFYAVLSTNYLEERIDAHLQPTGHQQGVLGALDMGGASTQIIFPPPKKHGEEAAADKVTKEHFWGESFLSYGVQEVRERVWNFMVEEHLNSGRTGVLENPCGFHGRKEELRGVELQGTGDAEACTDVIRAAMWGADGAACRGGELCAIGDVAMPPISGDFYAMSVFFYGLDCVRQLGPVDLDHVWPTPTLAQLYEAVSGFCEMDWDHMSENMTSSHKYTQGEGLLQYRCLEAVYMLLLLRDVYGLPHHSRNVTYALEARGMEVEWTLGFALAEVVNAEGIEILEEIPLTPSTNAGDERDHAVSESDGGESMEGKDAEGFWSSFMAITKEKAPWDHFRMQSHGLSFLEWTGSGRDGRRVFLGLVTVAIAVVGALAVLAWLFALLFPAREKPSKSKKEV
ncbi:unnamed protein product [Chrysoparadoxa australica]